MENLKKEISWLKSQIKILRLLYLALIICSLCAVVRIRSYYQLTFDQNQEILRYLEGLNSDLEEQNSYLQNILSEMNSRREKHKKTASGRRQSIPEIAFLLAAEKIKSQYHV